MAGDQHGQLQAMDGCSYSTGNGCETDANIPGGEHPNYEELYPEMLLNLSQPYAANSFAIPAFVCGALMVVVASLGLLGNLLIIWIFLRPRSSLAASVGVLLTGLAVVDALLLAVGAPVFATSAIYVYNPGYQIISYLSYMTVYAYPCASVLQTVSVWLMIVITLERFLAVSQPFLARKFCTRNRAKKALLLIFIVSVAYNVCRFWEFRTDARWMSEDTGFVVLALPALKANETYKTIYMTWMYFLFIFAFPFLVLSLFNALIVRVIRVAHTQQQRLSRQQRKEHDVATMMASVSLVYLLCNSLAFVVNAMDQWDVSGMHDVDLPPRDAESQSVSDTGQLQQQQHNVTDGYSTSAVSPASTTSRYSNLFYFLVDLNNLLVMIHCSVNFIIYYKFNARFRTQVRLLLRCGRQMNLRGLTIDSSSIVVRRFNYHDSISSCKSVDKFARKETYVEATLDRGRLVGVVCPGDYRNPR